MTPKITFAAVLLFFLTFFANPFASFAQNQSVSVTASYPIPIGDTFYSNYDGIIGTGLKYSRFTGANISINGTFAYTRSKYTIGSTNPITTNLNFYKLIVSVSRQIRIGNELVFNPEAGLGYARLSFRNDDQFDNDENANGFTTKLALHLNKEITNNLSLGVFSSYSLILIDKLGQALDTPYNKELHALNLGLIGTLNL